MHISMVFFTFVTITFVLSETLSCDRESISYVVLNPEYDLELDKNDIMLVLKSLTSFT